MPAEPLYTEAMVCFLWAHSFTDEALTPVISVNFMPLNHVGGRLVIGSSFIAGGTSYSALPQCGGPTPGQRF